MDSGVRPCRPGRALAPWLALVIFLAVPPFIWPHSWLLAYLAQSATMIVFALSYNLLLGRRGCCRSDTPRLRGSAR